MNGASTAGLMMRLAFSLGVVILMMVLAARMMRKRGMAGLRRASKSIEINVLARRGVGKHAAIAVVETAGRQLIVGVTDQRVTLLAEADDDFALSRELETLTLEHHGTALQPNVSAPALASGPARKGLLDTLRDITVRRV